MRRCRSPREVRSSATSGRISSDERRMRPRRERDREADRERAPRRRDTHEPRKPSDCARAPCGSPTRCRSAQLPKSKANCADERGDVDRPRRPAQRQAARETRSRAPARGRAPRSRAAAAREPGSRSGHGRSATVRRTSPPRRPPARGRSAARTASARARAGSGSPSRCRSRTRRARRLRRGRRRAPTCAEPRTQARRARTARGATIARDGRYAAREREDSVRASASSIPRPHGAHECPGRARPTVAAAAEVTDRSSALELAEIPSNGGSSIRRATSPTHGG